MPTLTKYKSLWAMVESTFESDGGDDGSGYTAIPLLELSDLADEKNPIATAYVNGSVEPSGSVEGADGASFRMVVPLIGLATAAGDGASPPAADWLDLILRHIFGGASGGVSTDGEGVNAGATATTIELDSAVTSVTDGYLIPVHETSVPAAAPRTQWVHVTGGTTTNPTFLSGTFTEVPSTLAVAYGTRAYRRSDLGGSTFSFVFRDHDVNYTLEGCRITSAKITSRPNELVRLEMDVSVSSKTRETKGALPAAATAPAITPVTGLLSPVRWGATYYGTSSVEIDLGIQANAAADVGSANGRSAHDILAIAPVVTISPLRTDALNVLKRAVTNAELVIQLGKGVLGSSILNTLAVGMSRCEIVSDSPADDGGRARMSVQLRALQPDTTYPGHMIQVVRA